MAEQQLFMYDVVIPVPQLHKCYGTCKHFGEKIDYPSWWFGEPRCLLCDGNHIKSILFDNRWFTYCDLYEKDVST